MVDHRKLSEPLTQTQNELKDLKAKLASYHKEKHSLKLAKIRAAQLDAQLKRETAQVGTEVGAGHRHRY